MLPIITRDLSATEPHISDGSLWLSSLEEEEERWGDLGWVKGKEMVMWMYYIREESIVNKNKNKTSKERKKMKALTLQSKTNKQVNSVFEKSR